MNHFHFTTDAVKPTIDFYAKYFDFKEIKLLGKTHVLRNLNGFVLGIDEGNESKGLPQTAHLGFTFEEEAQVASLFQSMQKDTQCKVTPLEKPSPRASHFYCLDPSGNKLEIGWYRFD